jgi:branched-chain amino acid transport system substrate-binding protein
MKYKDKSFQPTVVILLLSLLFFVSACGGASNASLNAPDEILLGASIPKTGSLSSFGLYQDWGYSAAIQDINEAGGLYLSQYQTKVPVRLITYDDKSDGKQAAANIQRLVTQDKVVALLGSSTPPVVIPASAIAQKMQVPIVNCNTPIRAFLGGAPKPGWSYAWDIFFDELDMTRQQFLAMNTQPSNHKVALFTDTEQDGVTMGALWEQYAAKYGYNVVYRANFPVGTTDFSSYIEQARASEADVVIAQMEMPDAINMWRQFQTLQFHPKAAFLEKATETVEWTSAMQQAGQGVMLEGYWYPTFSYPGASELRQRFELDTGQTYTQHIADAYTAAQVLMDAIVRAGNLHPQAINAAIAQTNKTYVVGPVNFAKGPGGQTSAIPTFITQWQNGQLQIVYPSRQATAKMIYPLPWNS